MFFWDLELILDGFLRPVILHIILLCSPRPVVGVWLRDYWLCFLENSNMYVANNSSILQYCHGMLIERVLLFYRTTELVSLARILHAIDVSEWSMATTATSVYQADHEAASSNRLVSGVGTCVHSSLCLIVYHGLWEIHCSSNSRRPW